MIKVCDAIMGSGKSQSAISYLNDHADKKFIYITPYLLETERIRDACPTLHFAIPNNQSPDYKFSKIVHTQLLLADGRNIATTHVAFKLYTAEMLELIRQHHYTLIVDEAVSVFQKTNFKEADIDILESSGFVNRVGEQLVYTGKRYDGDKFRDIVNLLQCNNLVPVKKVGRFERYYFWTLPIEVFTAFDDVIILTYMFDSQELKYFLDMNDLEYQYIGIHHDENGYRFVDHPDYVPEYVKDLPSKIHIFCDRPQLNRVGNDYYALSENWMRTQIDSRDTLRKNLYSYFRTWMKSPSENILWCTYVDAQNALRGRGFTNQKTAFNLKATNEYRDRTVLAYCVNLFADPQSVCFFAQYGIEYDTDGFALSTMIQWIWRSAIRDGKEIWIYIPSKRMRTLLEEWIAAVSESANP